MTLDFLKIGRSLCPSKISTSQRFMCRFHGQEKLICSNLTKTFVTASKSHLFRILTVLSLFLQWLINVVWSKWTSSCRMTLFFFFPQTRPFHQRCTCYKFWRRIQVTCCWVTFCKCLWRFSWFQARYLVYWFLVKPTTVCSEWPR